MRNKLTAGKEDKVVVDPSAQCGWYWWLGDVGETGEQIIIPEGISRGFRECSQIAVLQRTHNADVVLV